MNDRIWELFRQANHPHPKHGGNDMFFPEEFAELIVRECVNVCEGVTKEGEPLHLVSLGYSQNIKKHFGVE